MLATNKTYYRGVLRLDKNSKGDEVDWAKFFDKSSAYNLLYSLQIVQAVINEGDSDNKRAKCLNLESFFTAKLLSRHYPTAEELESDTDTLEQESPLPMMKRTSTQVTDEKEEGELRQIWAKKFVLRGGFNFILNDFMTCSLDSKADGENIDLKYMAFILQVMRTFIMAALANSDQDAYQIAQLARKQSSSVSDAKVSDAASTDDDKRFK